MSFGQKKYRAYIMTNRVNTVLYTGISSLLQTRSYQHKTKKYKGFTARYNVNKLVYFETFDRVEDAIAREKQIKAGSRKKKIDLINSMNPKWRDLTDQL